MERIKACIVSEYDGVQIKNHRKLCNTVRLEVRQTPGRGLGPWQEVRAALLELGNDDLLRPLASGPLVLASLGVWGRPWGVGAAGCYATMLGNDDPWLLCTLLRRVGRITLG